MKPAIDTWTARDHATRDAFDKRIARLSMVDDDGHVITPNNLSDWDAEALDRWDAREHDPAWQRVREVRERRYDKQQTEAQVQWLFSKLIIEIVIPVICYFIGLALSLYIVGWIFQWWTEHPMTDTDGLIVWMSYGCGLAIYRYIREATKHRDEVMQTQRDDQILREWELHEKLSQAGIFEIRPKDLHKQLEKANERLWEIFCKSSYHRAS